MHSVHSVTPAPRWFAHAARDVQTVRTYVWNAARSAPTVRMSSAPIADFAAIAPMQMDSARDAEFAETVPLLACAARDVKTAPICVPIAAKSAARVPTNSAPTADFAANAPVRIHGARIARNA